MLNGLVHLPLILPPVVTGYLLLLTFGRRAPVGAWLEETFGLVLAFRWTGAALAAAIMAFPLMVRAIRLAIEAVDTRIEDAAATLGASRLMVFATITLPLTVPGIIAGAVLAFAKAMGGGDFYTILRHILPQTASYVIVAATLAIPGFIVAESVLSLIGLGIQQPDPSWGNLLSIATNASILVLHPWLIWSPAIVIISAVLSFNLLGDGLRDALDPRSIER